MFGRRKFLAAAACGTTVAIGGRLTFAQDDEPKQLDAELVSQFVGKSHFDFETVKKLADQEPMLVNAAWDWGNGDWETGLGAASHVGRTNIAEFLLDKGARIDAFAATMLGMTSIVKPMLAALPNLHAVRGPHQIPLLSHAIVGRDRADEVFHLLVDAGADVNAASRVGWTPLMMAASGGRVEVIKVLVDRGADPSAKNAKGQTALDVAIERERQDAITYLRKL